MADLINPLPNLSQFNFEIGDTDAVVTKQNGVNAAIDSLAVDINTTVAGINQDAADVEAAAQNLNVDQIVHATGSGLPNELGAAQIITSTGTQTISEALDDRVNKGEVGQEEILIGDIPVTVQSRFEEYITPSDFGATGDGIIDDSSALEYALSDSRPLYMGNSSKNYRITRELSVNITSAKVLRSDGARITVDSASPIRRAVTVALNGNLFYGDGVLRTYCENNAYSAWDIRSPQATGDAAVYWDGYQAFGCRRSGTSYFGGDGLWIGGFLRNVILRNIRIRDVTAATGAIIEGSQSIAGITVTRDNANETDPYFTLIDGYDIENIYSDDSTVLDQDAIRCFQTYNNDSTLPTMSYVIIKNGAVKNAGGRAIKLQTEWAEVSSLKITRTGFPHSGFTGGPEIDFQTGGGSISGIQSDYRGAAPSRMIQFTPRRIVSRNNPTVLNIRDFTINKLGTAAGLSEFMQLSVLSGSGIDADAICNISDIGFNRIPRMNNFLILNGDKLRFFLNLENITARVISSVVHRVGATPLVDLNGKGIYCINEASTFFTANTPGNSNVALLGVNRGVSV